MRQKMRILCINYEFPPIGGGGGVACKGLAEQLVRQGHHIDIVTVGMSNLPKFEIVNGVHIHRVNGWRKNRIYIGSIEMIAMLYPMYAKARELTARYNYDINHTHFIVPSGIVSYWLKKKTNLPYVVTAHGSDVPGYNPDRFFLQHHLIKFIWKRIICNSQTTICCSNYLTNLVLKQACPVNLAVVPNGYTCQEGLADLNSKQNIILVVTRMFKRKGVQYLIEALKGMNTNWEIKIAGDGPYLEELKKQAASVNAKIEFLGFLGRKELDALYRKAKIFLFPSLRENFPMVLIEAMDAGCAVITTHAEGCSEVVGEAALKTEPGNVVHIQNTLNQLMNDDSERIRYGNMAKQRAGELSWETIALQTEAILYNAIDPSVQNLNGNCSLQQEKHLEEVFSAKK
jgi:glycosyltransferase involved in cell wall biosynthesis